MAVAHLSRFRRALPELFEDRPLPQGLNDYEVVPVDALEDPSKDPVGPTNGGIITDNVAGADVDGVRLVDGPDVYGTDWIDGAGWDPSHPGGLVGRWRTRPTPPADALAFYLPFHFYHPTWWGVYLLYEGVEWLQRYIERVSAGALPPAEAFRVARMFLYGHEQFHHIAECFSARLESTHRLPLFRTGIWGRYVATWGTDDCTEEALANAFGYQKALKYCRVLPDNQRSAANKALIEFIRTSPPGYREGVHYLRISQFEAKRRAFAEEYHGAALPSIPQRHPDAWLASPHAFGGIARVTSRVNYLVRKDTPMAWRAVLGGLPIRYREVARTLKRIGSVYEGPGKGSHEKWRSAHGKLISVPRHPGDLKLGTLRSIFSQAGHPMPASELKAFMDLASSASADP